MTARGVLRSWDTELSREFLSRSRWGRAIRALADNPRLAVVRGIDAEQLYILIFALGSAFAGLAVVKAARPGSYLRFYVQRFDPRSGRSGQFFAFARVP